MVVIYGGCAAVDDSIIFLQVGGGVMRILHVLQEACPSRHLMMSVLFMIQLMIH